MQQDANAQQEPNTQAESGVSPVGLVVVGSGHAGVAAAKAFREQDSSTPVTLVSADRHAPYRRPPLTKDYLTGDSGRDDIALTEGDWFGESDVDLRLGVAVSELDRDGRTLTLADGSRLSYDQLVLATGSRAQPLPVPGGDDADLILVRDLDSGDRLRALAEQRSRVLVIGSGFIGCEAAAQLAGCGSEVVLITGEDLPHEQRLGRAAGERIAGWLRTAGVELRTGSMVAEITHESDGWRVRCEDGHDYTGDAVVVGGGARPNVELAEAAGLRIDGGGIVVDASMRSVDDPRVFAVGDAAYAQNTTAGRALRIEHWAAAEAQGTVAGTVAAGGEAAWSNAPGFFSKIGDHLLKYSSWGDGFDEAELSESADGWSVRYRLDGEFTGVLAANDDEAFDRGKQELES